MANTSLSRKCISCDRDAYRNKRECNPCAKARRAATAPPCNVSGCDNGADNSGFCIKHYQRFRRYGDPCGGRVSDGSPLTWLRESINEATNSCIVWPFGRNRGYGNVWWESRSQPAHRVALILHTGHDPKDLVARHKCRERACVNIAHLEWGTVAENSADMLRDGTALRGEKHGQSKLTTLQVLAIRADPRAQQVIATEHGISRCAVSAIKSRRTWAWLQP